MAHQGGFTTGFTTAPPGSLKQLIAEAAFTPVAYDTLLDHAPYQLHADCPRCQHHVRLNVMQIAQRVGWDTPLTAIHAALRCGHCGTQGADMRIVSVHGRGGGYHC